MSGTIKQAEDKMTHAVTNYKINLTKIRSGRAHAGILDHVLVDYYGTMMHVSAVATVTVSDSTTLTVQPWENKMLAVIEKAIRESDLGLNPMINGTVIRVPMPALTEERRRELVKVIKVEAEDAKVAVRNVRRDTNNAFKNQLKDKLITEDEERRGGDEVQKMTDRFIAAIDKLLSDKEQELLTV